MPGVARHARGLFLIGGGGVDQRPAAGCGERAFGFADPDLRTERPGLRHGLLPWRVPARPLIGLSADWDHWQGKAEMRQGAVSARRQEGWITIGWQGLTMQVPEDWFPAALGAERAAGYLRVQNAEGSSLEVKWSNPRGTVDMEAQLEKYRKALQRAARKRHLPFEWKDKPKVPVREAKPDKNRRFFAWKGEAQGLGVIWYCRSCARVVIAQVSTPLGEDAATLASTILSSLEDHGEVDGDLWALYGLQVRVPKEWMLDRHQLMAGYTMLQFRMGDQILRAERWALANLALKSETLQDFLWSKCWKFWRDYRLTGADAAWEGHPAAEFAGRTRKLWVRATAPVRRLLRRPAADRIAVRAWHCEPANKVFAVHAIHPDGDTVTFERAVASVSCH